MPNNSGGSTNGNSGASNTRSSSSVSNSSASTPVSNSIATTPVSNSIATTPVSNSIATTPVSTKVVHANGTWHRKHSPHTIRKNPQPPSSPPPVKFKLNSSNQWTKTPKTPGQGMNTPHVPEYPSGQWNPVGELENLAPEPAAAAPAPAAEAPAPAAEAPAAAPTPTLRNLHNQRTKRQAESGAKKSQSSTTRVQGVHGAKYLSNVSKQKPYNFWYNPEGYKGDKPPQSTYNWGKGYTLQGSQAAAPQAAPQAAAAQAPQAPPLMGTLPTLPNNNSPFAGTSTNLFSYGSATPVSSNNSPFAGTSTNLFSYNTQRNIGKAVRNAKTARASQKKPSPKPSWSNSAWNQSQKNARIKSEKIWKNGQPQRNPVPAARPTSTSASTSAKSFTQKNLGNAVRNARTKRITRPMQQAKKTINTRKMKTTIRNNGVILRTPIGNRRNTVRKQGIRTISNVKRNEPYNYWNNPEGYKGAKPSQAQHSWGQGRALQSGKLIQNNIQNISNLKVPSFLNKTVSAQMSSNANQSEAEEARVTCGLVRHILNTSNIQSLKKAFGKKNVEDLIQYSNQCAIVCKSLQYMIKQYPDVLSKQLDNDTLTSIYKFANECA